MTEERAALLKEILETPDVPRKVAPKNVLRFVDRMQPKTQDMRDYLMAIFSSETQAESSAIREAWCANMTPNERKAFAEAFYRCCMNELAASKKGVRSNVEALAVSM
jgi:Tfp pilus assembly protein FimV